LSCWDCSFSSKFVEGRDVSQSFLCLGLWFRAWQRMNAPSVFLEYINKAVFERTINLVPFDQCRVSEIASIYHYFYF
jgi:hypothetical protein